MKLALFCALLVIHLCSYSLALFSTIKARTSLLHRSNGENNFDNFVADDKPQTGLREDDIDQKRDLDLILTERAKRFYDPKTVGRAKEKCILVAVDRKSHKGNELSDERALQEFSLEESLNELSELVGTAGLTVEALCVQRRSVPNLKTYVGSGKIIEIMETVNATNSLTLIIDDDLNSKQQRNLENAFMSVSGDKNIKILDRTAVILEIFAQHAKTREGQMQVELAMLEYRLSRGPSASGDLDKDSGCGFRGPGESKLETDKRLIRDRIVLLKKDIIGLAMQRAHHRKSRQRMGLPVIALVGYTNAGKSTLMNRLGRSGVLAENMLFATLDPTTRKIQLPRRSTNKGEVVQEGGDFKGQEILLTDTVGFISKLPTDLIAAFRATLEEVGKADILIHVCDRSNPVWEKQRDVVLRELDAIGCRDTPVIELWNKIDQMEDPEEIQAEAACIPVDVDAVVIDGEKLPYDTNIPYGREQWVNREEEGTRERWEQERKEIRLYKTEVETVETTDDEDQYVWSDEDDYIRDYSAEASSKRDEEDSYVWDVPAELAEDFDIDVSSSAISSHTSGGDSGRSGVGLDHTVHPSKRKTFVVAASSKTGVGFDDFIETLGDVLSLFLKEIEVFVPYSKDDGIIAQIHNQGMVLQVEYRDTGTYIRSRVPEILVAKLQPYRQSKLK